MTSLVLDGIGLLVRPDLSGPVGTLEVTQRAALAFADGRVAWVGAAGAAPACDARIDVAGRSVVPGFVDSHTHLVFGGDRTAEFRDRMAGAPYTAGGIASTVRATRAAPDEVLSARAAALAREALRSGTTTLEVKSGYGLTVADEARLVRIAATLTTEATFLGAHVVPEEYLDHPDDYVALVAGPMLDACAPHVRWVDVFCERGAFDAAATRTVLEAGARRGLGLRVHAGQLGPGPGVALACELGAASADHVTHLTGSDVDALASSGTVATLLPGAEFSTRSRYPDARRLVDAGAVVALASDCNPGTSFTTSMPLMVALGVREMHLTVEEALWAATAGGARALRRGDIGGLALGSHADAVVLDAPDPGWLAYRPGVDLVQCVVRGGTVVRGTTRPRPARQPENRASRF